MSNMEFRPARRTNAKPLIGLYSESGAGKTYSALLLARGFVGSEGRIAMIETESGRGEAYADPVEYPEIGGYDVLPLHDSFAPAVYGAAIDKAEKGKYDALIIDSASHEWEGVGGVLSMAADNEANGSKGQLVWQKPKIEHQRNFMLRFMQTNIPFVILCMRAKYPMVQTTNDKGKKEWTRSTVLEPKQSDDILFEMFVHGWIDSAHRFHRTKSTAKSLEPIFLDNEPITLETGQKLSAWARGDAGDSREAALLSDAQEAAEGGIEVLRTYWTRLNKADRAALKSQANRLKAIAERADTESVDPILGEESQASPEPVREAAE
jgi:AAA domain-containing protein